MKYDFTISLGTQNFDVKVDPVAKYGYFEHNELGDECGGGLWFDDEMFLRDYDGVYELPKEVKLVLYKAKMIREDEYESF